MKKTNRENRLLISHVRLWIWTVLDSGTTFRIRSMSEFPLLFQVVHNALVTMKRKTYLWLLPILCISINQFLCDNLAFLGSTGNIPFLPEAFIRPAKIPYPNRDFTKASLLDNEKLQHTRILQAPKDGRPNLGAR
jgi:hypothetical protein